MSGPPVPALLVHGLIGTLDEPDLLSHFGPRPVLAPDLLGYGRFAGAPAERIDLDGQVDHLQGFMDDAGVDRVHLVGHSVGGVVAVLFADRHPQRVASLISVEGNFTLADAFWSVTVAGMTPDEAQQMLAGSRADPAGWLRDAGVGPDERCLALATRWLGYQPASTLQAMARSVVEVTGREAYERTVRGVLDRTDVYLVAGERSRDGWDVPEWALRAARSLTVISQAGHLMMAEEPRRFAEAVGLLLADAEARVSRA